MSARIKGARGRPLAMLAVVTIGWVTMRAFFWDVPLSMKAHNLLAAPSRHAEVAEQAMARAAAPGKMSDQVDGMRDATPQRPSYVIRVPLKLRELLTSAESPAASVPDSGDQRLRLAAMYQLPATIATGRQVVTGVGPDAFVPSEEPEKQRRWSVDAWVLWRQGSGIAQGRRPSYGASQAGAVFNYRLRPSSNHDPRVFVRGYRALIDNPETEVSLGISARPVPDIPLRFHAEMRATERFKKTEYRPSGFVTTELAPQQLPFDARAEVYAQAGFVGGDFPTHFADGQVHVMRELKDFDLGRVSLGAAAWGGVQKGTGRADVGPSLRVDLDIGPVPARIAVNYRYQVAGDAEPGSGVAVTVSTRF